MRIINTKLSSLPTERLHIGKVGENEHTKVKIDCTDVFTDYPSATVAVAVKSPHGETYPVTVTVSSNKVEWIVTDSDLAYAGGGEIQITFTKNGEVIKSAIGKTLIAESLVPGDPAPVPVSDWLIEAEEALEGFEQDVSDAEAWANGTRGGTAVPSTDPAYHNNAKYWAEHLNIHVSGTTLIIND